MNQCMQCGHPARPEDVYCEVCGFQLHANQSSQEERKRSWFQLPAGLGSWKTLRWVIAIGAVALLSLGGLCGVSGILYTQRLLGPQVAVTVVREVQVVTATPTQTPTNTPGPSPTPTITATPTPTNTPRPTNTPTPVPTPMPTTSPDAVLKPGDVWYEDGLTLLLVEPVELNPSYLRVTLYMQNVSDNEIFFEIAPQSYRMVSNLDDVVYLGHNLKVGSYSLKPGERLMLSDGGVFNFNFGNDDVTHVIVEIVQVSRINRARWMIEIPH